MQGRDELPQHNARNPLTECTQAANNITATGRRRGGKQQALARLQPRSINKVRCGFGPKSKTASENRPSAHSPRYQVKNRQTGTCTREIDNGDRNMVLHKNQSKRRCTFGPNRTTTNHGNQHQDLPSNEMTTDETNLGQPPTLHRKLEEASTYEDPHEDPPILSTTNSAHRAHPKPDTPLPPGVHTYTHLEQPDRTDPEDQQEGTSAFSQADPSHCMPLHSDTPQPDASNDIQTNPSYEQPDQVTLTISIRTRRTPFDRYRATAAETLGPNPIRFTLQHLGITQTELDSMVAAEVDEVLLQLRAKRRWAQL